MKRADDFKAFIGKTHTLGESLAFQPEAPLGYDIDYLARIEREKPVADNPFEPSAIRKSGLKVWDSVYIPLPEKASLEPKRSKDLATLRGTNAEWEQTKLALGMIGKPDGVHYIRPKGPYILDLMNDDIRFLQGAHILAHRTDEELATDDWTFGELFGTFFRNLIKLFAAKKYGLKVNVHPMEPVQDSFDLYGIEVFGSTDLRAPVMTAAAEGVDCRLVTDRTVVCLLGSVGIEAHPCQAADGTDWKAVNKWSCLPTLVALAGWECVDYVTHGEKTEYKGIFHHAIPCTDLQDMASFPEMLDLAKAERGLPGTGPHLFTVDDWFESEDFKAGLEQTPQLPCPHCIRLNRNAKNIVPRPMTGKPRRPFKDMELSSSNEVQAWVNYVKFMRNCIEIGRKATTYATGSVTTMKRRNSNFKKRVALQRKIASLEKKYVRKMTNGYISEAEALADSISRLKSELLKTEPIKKESHEH